MALALVTHRMVDSEYTEVWKLIQNAAVHWLKNSEEQLEAREPIELLLSSFQILELGNNQELADAIIDRQDLLAMSTNDVSLVFASLSRFISLNNLDSAKFSQFKY